LYKEKESEIRNELSKMIQRGKVELSIFIEQELIDKAIAINKNLVKNYFEQIKNIGADLNISPSEEMLYAAIRMPDTLRTDANILEDAEWKVVMQCVKDCINQFNKFREQEGLALYKDINDRISLIEQNLETISLFDEARIINIRERIKKNLNEFIGQENIDKNRFEQEIIYYIEKFDINEERVRLKNHCKYFYDTMKEENPGKKLGFITQEIGREINTIGSKANDHEIQHLVVRMKDELEKVKEQLMNVL
jgi:uncharacterized protein (TIGR00255 family)